ncbi:MAG: polysaccharide deacetylase family protein [Polaromonas sp.]|nr:polysaccharide deacetylase family protein [Polaromonas sp.]
MPSASNCAWALVWLAACAVPAGAAAQNGASCAKPLYLTFDTGHMEVAPLIAQVLSRQKVRVTFFAANEKTKTGDGSLGAHWAPWWKARAAEGHEFASHTYDHAYWRGDLPGAAPAFRIRPSAGSQEGQALTWDAPAYCASIAQAAQRLQEITGKKPLPLFRAPGGKTSPRLLAAAKACGCKALKDIRSGDILVAHLGIWSRQDAWAPTVLEPLLVGLKDKGFCFETLREHPAYQSWIAAQGK